MDIQLAIAPSLAWDWRYGVNDEKAEALYKKAVSEQWQAEQLNWEYLVDPARNLLDPARETLVDAAFFRLLKKSQREHFEALCVAETLSQTLHGEQGALLVSCQLAQSLPGMDAKLFAATQAMDEARHIEVFSRYIYRLHDVYEPATTLGRVLGKVMSARHWQAKLVGMQIMVEGLALANFSKLRAATNCELLRNLLRFVMRDEARHVAFGNQYLKSSLAQMHADERAEVEDFAVELVREYRMWGRNPGDLSNFFANLIAIGVDPPDYLAQLKAGFAASGSLALAPKMMQGLEAVIMPGLRRVGLITDRVRDCYLGDELDAAVDMRTLEDLEKSLLA
ncbi:ferritin-like domain-containing protein [Collimonas humicola]|uniref:ferritin-like domain-containing protein n=1 Tax=Collimonas humicola TaxID=2825886 RepID=UPI001B8BAFDD|nr:ferritin-like domain-containing protein [Collimonas humicola]